MIPINKNKINSIFYCNFGYCRHAKSSKIGQRRTFRARMTHRHGCSIDPLVLSKETIHIYS